MYIRFAYNVDHHEFGVLTTFKQQKISSKFVEGCDFQCRMFTNYSALSLAPRCDVICTH